MTSVAWAIIFATLFWYDVMMVRQHGGKYPTQWVGAVFMITAFVVLVICSLKELSR